MKHVFLSYASNDRERAGALARALEARGFTVWWDRVIPPGRAYDDVIEEALDSAACVAVLWSKASSGSQWVRIEASEALKKQRLVPAVIDEGATIPLEFRRVQAADLSHWQAAVASPAFDQFCDALAAHTRDEPGPVPRPPPQPPPPPPPPPPPEPPAVRKGLGKGAWAGIAAAIVVAVAVGSQMSGGGEDGRRPLPAPLPVAAASGIDQSLRWRDYILAYEGRVVWDGRSNSAQVSAAVTDTGNGRRVTSGTYPASVLLDAPGRIVLQTQVAVSGDSRTPGAHSHPVNLVFEQTGGGWVFVRNCMTSGRPDSCYQAQ